MHGPFAFAAPFALMLPFWAQGAGMVPVSGDDAARGEGVSAPHCRNTVSAAAMMPAVINPLSAMRESAVARQIRIEQRVVVRIVPQPGAARLNMMPDFPDRPPAPRFEERSKEKCVALGDIAGVQTGSGNRLVLFMRDRRMISVNLEKSCRARDFYAGFYVEKNKDGRLCIDRDKLQSRTGARCQVDTMRQLVQTRG